MKKNIRLFVLLVLVPSLIFWLSPLFETQNFRVTDYKTTFLVILLLPIIGSLLITYFSYKNSVRTGLVLGVLLTVITTGLFLITYSLSNFGF